MQPHFVESQEHAGYFGRSLFKCQGQDTTLLVFHLLYDISNLFFNLQGYRKWKGRGPQIFADQINPISIN